GKAPAWLFQRMVRLSREIAIVVVEDYGRAEMLRRLSDPFWFPRPAGRPGFRLALQRADHDRGFSSPC
ncbi:MAG: DUF763 domain-containing protein, partial [Chloroflexota bacterium]